MKKIIHITHTDIKNDWRIRKELKSLLDLDNVDVEGIGIDYFYDIEFPVDNIKSSNVKRFNVKNRYINLFFTFISLCLLLKVLISKKIDILHAHDTPALFIGMLYKMLNKNTVLIYDAHELESNKGGQIFLFKLLTIVIEKISFRYVDHFITVSDSILKYYEKRFNLPQSTVIYNAPNYVLSKINVESLRQKYNIPPDSNIFVHVGLLNSGRGIEHLLEIFSSDRSNKNYLIFFGFGDLTNTIIGFQNTNDNILYFGNVENFKLHSYLIQCDYGICTISNDSLSDYFSLPNKFFEYINSGLTTISSDFPELKLATDKIDCGYYYPPSYNFLNENNKKIKYACPEDYSWIGQEKKLRKIYEDFLQR